MRFSVYCFGLMIFSATSLVNARVVKLHAQPLCHSRSLAPAPSHATTVLTSVDDFTILAGRTFSANRNVSVTGNIGAGSNVWLGSSSTMRGSIYTTGRFSISQKATVTGSVIAKGNVNIGQSSTLGPIDASGNISISRRAKIHGDVTYASRYWASSSAVIDGTVTKGSPDVWQAVTRTNPGFSYGSGNLSYGEGEDNTIAPGSYNNLWSNKNSTIRLSAGTYNFRQFSVGKGTHIIADTSSGDVVVNMATNLWADQKSTFKNVGSGSLTFQAGRSIALSKDILADASFISFGNLGVNTGSAVTGQLYAGNNLWLGQNVQVTGSPAGVPEPATILFLIVGLYCCRVKSPLAKGKR